MKTAAARSISLLVALFLAFSLGVTGFAAAPESVPDGSLPEVGVEETTATEDAATDDASAPEEAPDSPAPPEEEAPLEAEEEPPEASPPDAPPETSTPEDAGEAPDEAGAPPETETAEPQPEEEPQAEVAAGETMYGPRLTGVRISSTSVKRPGVLTVEIDYIEEDTGVTEISVGISVKGVNTYPHSAYFKIYQGKALYTGTAKLDIVIPAEAVLGDWYVHTVGFRDQAGHNYNNNAYYDANIGGDIPCYSHYDSRGTQAIGPLDIFPPTFVIVDEFDVAMELSLSNPYLAQRVSDMDEGKTCKIMIDDTSQGVLPAEVFEAIRGKDKTLVLHRDAYQWVINGLDVTGPAKDVNTTTTFGTVKGSAYGVAEEDVITINFAPNGELPGKVRVRMKSDYLYNQQQLKGQLYLYYEFSEEELQPQYEEAQTQYEEYIRQELEKLREKYGDEWERLLEADASLGIITEDFDWPDILPGYLLPIDGNFDLVFDGTDKWCYFDITHNSKYLISSSPLKASRLTLSDAIRSVAVNKSLKAPKVTAKPAGQAIKWSSSNTKIAKVNSKTGKVTATGKTGTVTITAKAGGEKASYKLVVYAPDKTYKVKLKAASKQGTVSKTQTATGGKTITVKAKAKKGYAFAGWYDGKTLLSTKATYKYKVCKNVTLTAKFTKK